MMFASESIRHTCYEDFLPPWMEQTLSDMYQSAFCVLEYFSLYKTYRNINALAIYTSESDPKHMLLYSIENNTVNVLNELFDIEQRYLQYFINFVFGKYPGVTAINLNRSKCQAGDFALPSRAWRSSEDTVIELPETVAEYRSKLGKHTRSNLSNYHNRLKRVYDDFTFATSEVNQADPAVISRIIEMNKSRMRGKKIKSGYDGILEDRIINFSRKYGFTSTLSVGGKIVAGTIFYEVGNHCFLEAISHDPAHDNDRLGQVCLYLTIKHAIRKGRESFHLLWGEYDYKYRLLGVKQELHSFSLYQSELHRQLCLPRALTYRAAFFREQLSYWLRKYLLNRFK
jgi:hypothetical protein